MMVGRVSVVLRKVDCSCNVMFSTLDVFILIMIECFASPVLISGGI